VSTFQATLQKLEPAIVQAAPAAGSPKPAAGAMGKLDELIDRIEATIHGSVQAGRGMSTTAWTEFAQQNPGVRDAINRVVSHRGALSYGSGICDAATQVFLGALLQEMKGTGLDTQAASLSGALAAHYAHRSPGQGPCLENCGLLKRSGGALSVAKGILEATAKASAADRAKVESCILRALQATKAHNNGELWGMLAAAWRSCLMLVGLATTPPRVSGLARTADGFGVTFKVLPGFGPFSGEMQIPSGQLQLLLTKLPSPMQLKCDSDSISVVPVKKSAGVEVIEKKGATSGGPGLVQVEDLGSRSRQASVSAGIVGSLTTTGERVEPSANPRISSQLIGESPALHPWVARVDEPGQAPTEQQDPSAFITPKKPQTDQAKGAQNQSQPKAEGRIPRELEVNGDYLAGGVAILMVLHAAFSGAKNGDR
jgi:hypothetical protein